MLCLAQVALTPLACASFSIPMICSSLNLLFISFCSFYLRRTTPFNCPLFRDQANLVLELTSNLERVGTRVSRLEGWKHTERGIQYRATRIPDEAGWLAQIVLPGSGQKRAGGMYYLLDEAEAKALRMAKIVEFCQ